MPILRLNKISGQTTVVPGYAAMKHVRIRMITSENKGPVLEIELPDQLLRKEYPFSSRTIAERVTLPSQKRAEWRSLLSR